MMVMVTISVILVLNIVLPTLDTFTDINLVNKLYRGGHCKMATAMLIPFLLNYLYCLLHNILQEGEKY